MIRFVLVKIPSGQVHLRNDDKQVLYVIYLTKLRNSIKEICLNNSFKESGIDNNLSASKISFIFKLNLQLSCYVLL